MTAHQHPLVSILIPCYNVAEYLAACLDSVFAQTYPAIEVIAVNDGSTDGTLGILRDYEGRHANLRVIDQPNAGQCASFNRAFRESRGSYISFFDSDDLLSPDKIERQVDLAFRNGEVRDVIATCAWGRFVENPAEAERQTDYPLFRTMEPLPWLLEAWGNRLMMHGATWLIPRAVLQQSGLWDERLTLINDHEFFCRVMLASREIVYVPGPRTYYRSYTGSNMSGWMSEPSIRSAYLSQTLANEHLLKVEDSPRTRRVCANKLQSFIYRFYPQCPDLMAAARSEIARLGGADLKPNIGGPLFGAASAVVGWKAAKRIQSVVYRFGYHDRGLRRRFASYRRG